MRKKQKSKDKKNLKLGFYFGFLVLSIIIVSFIFKVLDVFRSSKFDGNSHFNVVVLNRNNAEIFSFSPQEKKLNYLFIDRINDANSLREVGIPIDGKIKSTSKSSEYTKDKFIKFLFNYFKLDTDLSIIDVARLAILSQGIGGDKLSLNNLSFNDKKTLSDLSSSLFIDKALQDENRKIQITNSTNVQGLGNKFAKQISNNGGNVVLVNTSQEPTQKSVIYYMQDSYTVNKISKKLNIPIEKRDMNSISDILIIIGMDRVE